jgi:hypothetical protein
MPERAKMQKDLLSTIAGKNQRETAGSSSSSRFNYQKSWAFCEMLHRHMVNADYLVAFEFHDDVVFIEPSANPQKADFVQVKTSDSASPRKLAGLLYRKKTANSILGKMCLNFSGLCASHDVRVMLVSNVAFEFADKTARIGDIDKKYRDKIAQELKAEIPALTDAQLAQMHFIVSGIGIQEIEIYLNGQAMELFRSHFGENHGFNVHSWVRLIKSEIVRKNDYASDKIADVSELIARKCINKSAIIDSLNIVAKTRTTPDMELVSGELRADGWASAEIIRINKSLPQAIYDYTDATNTEAQDVIATMTTHFNDNIALQKSIGTYVHSAITIAAAAHPSPYNSPPYLGALAILVFHEKI